MCYLVVIFSHDGVTQTNSDLPLSTDCLQLDHLSLARAHLEIYYIVAFLIADNSQST